MAFPATKDAPAPPPRKVKPQYYACESCSAPLVGQWVTKDGGKIRNPEDDTNHCFKCAGLIEVAKIPKNRPARDWIMVGALGSSFFWFWVVGKVKGWW